MNRARQSVSTALLAMLLANTTVASAQSAEWGQIGDVDANGRLTLLVKEPQDRDKLILPSATAQQHLNRATTVIEGNTYELPFRVDPKTHTVHLQVPDHPHTPDSLPVQLYTGRTTGQFGNGHILLAAKDAQVEGDNAKLETDEESDRIGFWTKQSDTVHWSYAATRPGMYEAHLTYSKASGTKTRIQLQVAKSLARATLEPTGSWYHYRSLSLGRVYIPHSGGTKIAVACSELDGGAVMNLKAINLVPTGEGTPIIQQVDEAVTLHARDVTIQGVKVQYERLPHKNTVGYWINTSDQCYWDFTVRRPGTFAVEILQGCGEGHGGSDVALEVAGQQLKFQVEETGHFQNFVPRYVGQITLSRPDQYQLWVKPIQKAAGAVMDLRKIRLVPIITP